VTKSASSVDYAQVPDDLMDVNPVVKFINEFKAAAVVKALIPVSRLLPAPKAAHPGILMYHRVVPDPTGSHPTWNVTPDRFRDQLEGLLSAGYEAWSLNRLLETVRGEGQVAENVFVVTFDDGYANNFTHALPILLDLNVPATIFLATGYLDSVDPFPFDDWTHKGSADVHPDTWRALTTDECHELLKYDSIDFGSHTHTHEDFRERPVAFRNNVRSSIRHLRREFGIRKPTLSLPYGIINEGFAGEEYSFTSAEEGAICCLTTEEELISPDSSGFGWGRFIAEQHDTAATLRVKLGGWRDAVRNQWRRLRGK
jgi:peptidoglycan/xylan/chitin deacetylase (PgdA/CDA1 family)